MCASRGEELREKYKIAVTTDNCAAVEGAGVIVNLCEEFVFRPAPLRIAADSELTSTIR